jgi:hypothetical protein
MMNKDYKNFFGGLDADVDIDSPKDFVNQGGDGENTDGSPTLTDTWSALQESISQYGASDAPIDEYAQGFDLYKNRDVENDFSSVDISNVLEERRKANKKANRGKGVSAFAKGLSQGLGLITGGQTPPPNAGGVDTDAKTAGYTNERRNPVIPILIGLIGVAVLVFAISKSKKGQAKPMPMPMPTE